MQKNCIMYTYRVYNCLFDLNKDDLDNLKKKIEEKYLYDYFSNYNSIKTYETCEHVKLDKYKKYLTEICTFYDEHKKKYECCNGSWLHDCFNYFKCDDNLNPHKLLYKLNNGGTGSCDKLEKEKKPSSSGNSVTSQGEESNIMNTFYTGPCKHIGDGRLMCSLRQASHISPKFPFKPLKYNTDEKYAQNKMNFPTYANPSGVIVQYQENHSTLESNDRNSNDLSPKKIEHVKTENTKNESTDPLNPVSSETQKKPSQTVEVIGGFKWKFGNGTLSCPPKNSNEDKYNLCRYIRNLKETHNIIKNLNMGSVDPLNNNFSQVKNLINFNLIEKTNQRGITMGSNSDSTTNIISNMDYPGNRVHEEHVLNSNYIRVSMVAALILGIIFLFFIYYKVNEN
ncbi:hypothetical protein PCYB_001730 [Plasmodium cynomolgi strain B]|uniref:CYIR protein n=1 Tax=Plasmodium cynomolgi (strain B) TaxID=1120755 RepID=K6V2E3_PLACD|nr:hypothetical protein PCYB_001730 [Plasmodium cynomolgi strain B]GAB69425.1 hypothetical protein PCYB_001730 [Plasmodium cynomolgi strain B]